MIKNINSKLQMSDSILVAFILTISGGFLDTYSYLSRGNVFANAQTGNIVLLGISLVQKQWNRVPHYFISILFFALGIVIAEIIHMYFKNSTLIHWRQIIILGESLLLFSIAFIPVGKYDICANICISFVCALQYQTFRKINCYPLATTMCTGNLRTATEGIFYGIIKKEPAQLKKGFFGFFIIFLFIFGVILGTIFHNILGSKSILIPAGLLFFVFIILFIK